MALPVPLRGTVTPQELEMIACQQLVQIIPLIAMEKTAFISVLLSRMKNPRVCSHRSLASASIGCIRSAQTTKQSKDSIMDGGQPQDEEEVPYRRS